MFQYVWFDKKKWSNISKQIVPNDFLSFDDLIAISPLYWKEHCVECGEPLCYYNCTNWEVRIDKKCRRFVYGIRKGENKKSFNATVKLKKWENLNQYVSIMVLLA